MGDVAHCLPNICLLHQEWANYGPQANSSLLPMFINKVLLEHSLTMYYLRLLSCYKGRTEQLQQKPSGPQNLKYLLYSRLLKKFANPCLILTEPHFDCGSYMPVLFFF